MTSLIKIFILACRFTHRGVERVIKSSVQIEYFIDRYKHITIKSTEKMHSYTRNMDMEKKICT